MTSSTQETDTSYMEYYKSDPSFLWSETTQDSVISFDSDIEENSCSTAAETFQNKTTIDTAAKLSSSISSVSWPCSGTISCAEPIIYLEKLNSSPFLASGISDQDFSDTSSILYTANLATAQTAIEDTDMLTTAQLPSQFDDIASAVELSSHSEAQNNEAMLHNETVTKNSGANLEYSTTEPETTTTSSYSTGSGTTDGDNDDIDMESSSTTDYTLVKNYVPNKKDSALPITNTFPETVNDQQLATAEEANSELCSTFTTIDYEPGSHADII